MGCLAALVAIVLYRAYQEYYLPIQQERKLTALRGQFEEESERAWICESDTRPLGAVHEQSELLAV